MKGSVFMTPRPQAPPLHVLIGTTPGDAREFCFTSNFRIGRVEACEVCIRNEYVSRAHAEVAFENGQWWVRDLNSSNGIFVEGRQVPAAPVGAALSFRLGVEGPVVSLRLDQPQPVPPPAPKPAAEPDAVARYVEHYFGTPAAGQTAGEHTMMVRRAYQHVQAKQKRRYAKVIAVLLAVAAAAGGWALYLHHEVAAQQATARDLFYTMKSLDLNIANLERIVMDSDSRIGADEIRRARGRRQDLESSYDRYLAALHIYDPKMPEQKRLILRVARIFGECELAMPPEFAAEIENYIGKWRSTGRLARGIETARQNGYAPVIAKALLDAGLPPQFFYLALQESGFDPFISGPLTRKGYAKGMWQFIPETAVKYGLRLGPLVDLPRADTGDDRHHWEKATRAAVRYIKDLYATDAQASGLLVMACYNWGEDQVLPLVRSMPANPRERNFWRLLAAHRAKIPPETYDYVLYIASAAVIGENPRLFGFAFDNPLADAGRQ